MKQKDLAMIIVVAVVAGIFSVVVAKLVFAKPADRQQKVEVVDAITTDFTLPDSRYFNSSSINPTQLIRINSNNNTTPFNSTTQ